MNLKYEICSLRRILFQTLKNHSHCKSLVAKTFDGNIVSIGRAIWFCAPIFFRARQVLQVKLSARKVGRLEINFSTTKHKLFLTHNLLGVEGNNACSFSISFLQIINSFVQLCYFFVNSINKQAFSFPRRISSTRKFHFNGERAERLNRNCIGCLYRRISNLFNGVSNIFELFHLQLYVQLLTRFWINF